MSKNQIYKHGEKRGLSHGTGPVHLNCRACARNIEMLGKCYNESVYYNKFSGQISWTGTCFLIHIVWYYFVALKVLVAQLCLTLCDPMEGSPSGSSVHGIPQVRILECVAISFSRGSSRPRDWTWVSCIAGRFFTIWATSIICLHCIVYPSLFLIRIHWSYRSKQERIDVGITSWDHQMRPFRKRQRMSVCLFLSWN